VGEGGRRGKEENTLPEVYDLQTAISKKIGPQEGKSVACASNCTDLRLMGKKKGKEEEKERGRNTKGGE